MRARLAAILVLALACAKERAVPDAPAAAAAQAQAQVGTPSAGADFEPPDAQAKAEAVLNEAFNRDKVTRLQMAMTTIVGQTSSLMGSATGLAAAEERIDAKLSRLRAKVTETEVVIQLPGAILFDFDSATIRPDAERALTDVAQVIASYAARPVRVEGHTDAIAPDEYNRSLSDRRAQAVAAWLGAHGVERERLTPVGFGESKPVATNDTAAGRQQNRRVEVVIAKK